MFACINYTVPYAEYVHSIKYDIPTPNNEYTPLSHEAPSNGKEIPLLFSSPFLTFA